MTQLFLGTERGKKVGENIDLHEIYPWAEHSNMWLV